MICFLLRLKKYLIMDIGLVKIVRNDWREFIIDTSLNRIRKKYFILSILLSLLLVTTLLYLPINLEAIGVIGVTIANAIMVIMCYPILLAIIRILILVITSILGFRYATAEKNANDEFRRMMSWYLPLNHYLFAAMMTYFPLFLILYCRHFSWVHWLGVYNTCITYSVGFIEAEFIGIAFCLILNKFIVRSCCYNLKYNSLSGVNRIFNLIRLISRILPLE